MLNTLLTISVVIFAILGIVVTISVFFEMFNKKKQEDKEEYIDVISPPAFLGNCPCCGGTAKVKTYKHLYYVACTSCELQTNLKNNIEAAADVWNRRTEATDEGK